MTTLIDEFSLADHLESAGRDVLAIGAQRWQLVAGREKAVRGVVTQRGGWLAFEFPWRAPNGGSPEALVALASRCGTLPELLKIARDHAEPVFDLRAELRIGDARRGGFLPRDGHDEGDESPDSASTERRVDALLDTFDRTLDAAGEDASSTNGSNGATTSARGESRDDGHHEPAGGSSDEPLDLVGLCGEAGWSCHARPHGRVAVPLDVSGLFCEALVTPRDDGGFEAAYTLEAGERSFLAAAASSLFLLRANRVSRMARLSMTYSPATDSGADTVESSLGPVTSPARRVAVRGESEGGGPNGSTGEGLERDGSPWDRPRLAGVRFRWDVVLPGPVDANDLGVALSALSAACRTTVRELQVLAGDQLARSYLAAQGMFS